MPQKRLPPPDILTDAEAREWKLIVDSFPADYFATSDIGLLVVYISAGTKYREAADGLDENGLTYTNKQGRLCANPLVGVMHSFADIMGRLATRLRLCPSARYAPRTAARKLARTAGGTKRPF